MPRGYSGSADADDCTTKLTPMADFSSDDIPEDYDHTGQGDEDAPDDDAVNLRVRKVDNNFNCTRD